MKADFYVYIYFRLDGSPCYVGKGRGRRWRTHCHRACSNGRLAKIISNAGGNLPIVVIRKNLSNDEARSIERAFISAIGRGRRGPLVNMTDGGEGIAGIPMLDEIKRKISRANRGRRLTAEHRANLSRARKEMFARRRAEGIKTALSPEHRAAISAGNMGKTMSVEARANLSAAKKGRPCGEVQRQRLLEYARNKTPEHRAKLAAACIERNKRNASAQRYEERS
jgi:NUMOD3 motif